MPDPDDLFASDPRNEKFISSGDRADLPPEPALKVLSGCALFFIGILLASGVLLAAVAINDWVRTDVLAERGITITGVVTDRDSSGIGSDASYRVDYTYLANDMEYSASQGVNHRFYLDVKVGSSLIVTYDPEHPDTSIIGTPEGHQTTKFVLAGFAVVWCVAVVAISVAIWRSVRAPERLRRQGEVVYGEVMECSLTPSTNTGMLTVRYWFHSPKTTRRLEDRTTTFRADLAEEDLPAPGAPVAVLYRSDKHFKLL